MIVLDRGIFLREHSSRRKIPRSKTITDEFTQWPKQRWCKVIIVINNRYFDNFVSFMCIFWQKHKENSIFYHFCTHPCKRISISPDMMIIARCDKCANTGWIARGELCLRLRANGAHDNTNVTRKSHYHKSLLRDNDRAVFRAKLVIIYVDWITLLRRLLIMIDDFHNISWQSKVQQQKSYHGLTILQDVLCRMAIVRQ